MRSVRNVVIAICVVSALAIGLFFALRGGGGDDQPSAGGGPTIDAGGRVYVPPAPDAATEMSREQITALSKRGFYSLASTEPAQVYIDDQLVGPTPLTELPVKPGVHKVRVVVKNKPPKELKITVVGGRTTDDGTLTWTDDKPK